MYTHTHRYIYCEAAAVSFDIDFSLFPLFFIKATRPAASAFANCFSCSFFFFFISDKSPWTLADRRLDVH